MALRILDRGHARYPNSIYLILCRGEILGDVVKAIKCFEEASQIENTQGNPLPYINAARTYQQLSQPCSALSHIAVALQYDSFLPMTYVDLAQIYLNLGRTKDALQGLDYALTIARHCSEIRDVLTARTIANIQLELEEKEGITRANSNSAI